MIEWIQTVSIHHPWLLPAFIFCARVGDVSLGTLRMRFVSRDYKLAAALVGFVEIFIWITAISQLILTLDRWTSYVAYAGGYATGTYLGLIIERRLALGTVMVKIFPTMDASGLIDALRREGFGATVFAAEGARGPLKVIYTILPSHAFNKVYKLIQQFNPKAFFTVQAIETVHAGVHPARQSGKPLRFFRNGRLGK